MKFRKSEIKDFDSKEKYIIEEIRTDRHICACLGSCGLSFCSDIDRFKEYLKQKGSLKLLKIIKEERSLTEEEIKELAEVKDGN